MPSISCWVFEVCFGEWPRAFLDADVEVVGSVERGKIAGGLKGGCGGGGGGAAVVVCWEIAYSGGSDNSSTDVKGPAPILFPPDGPLQC
ncbi:unnamed protein product [Rodentolepis nana]|uniref:Uncharacterized protein n=1 Tax=Rodentolepis nana TaxID=102285 RepID=A0A0R3TI05_RODNA|nr:unnamed protein product [Rodentolepis nana]